MTILRGAVITMRPAGPADVDDLVAIRGLPEVRARWDETADEDVVAAVTGVLADPDEQLLVIELAGHIVGAVEWAANGDPQYAHASLDIYVDPAVHGRGIGTDAVRTLARHLVADLGFHRLVIDPAADNDAAIRCYEKVGFRPVGVMRQYERGADGTFHDGLLMDLLADDLR